MRAQTAGVECGAGRGDTERDVEEGDDEEEKPKKEKKRKAEKKRKKKGAKGKDHG